jgi:hypothetical protein
VIRLGTTRLLHPAIFDSKDNKQHSRHAAARTKGIAALGLVSCVLFLGGNSFAAGGACPSAANYINAATPNGPLVTLSSLGVTSCYYVAANGSDSNTGTDEAHPWGHAPGMPTCSNNCATLQNQGNGPPAGTGFIFRGGDTWHFGNSGASPYTGGSWITGSMLNGSQANPYYIGVDKSWYAGGSWARPILTADNPTSASTTLGPCAYHSGSSNNMLAFDGASHFILDNFELTGFCQDSSGAPNGKDQYITYGYSGDMRFLNLYLHGWTHQQFGVPSDPQDCSAGVCFNISIFHGGDEPNVPDDTFRYVVIDGSDSDPHAAQACYCDFWDVAYSYIGHQSNVITRYNHVYHDNLYEYWVENGHGNVMESVAEPAGTNVMYNSVFRHINYLNENGDPFIWWLPDPGTTDYFFNLLIYDVNNMEYFIAGNNNSNQGTYVLFNDTFQSNDSTAGISCSATGNSSTVKLANMQWVTESSTYLAASCSGRVASDVTGLLQTNAVATSNGYKSSDTYAYSPTYGTSPTVGQGTNQKNGYCAALQTAANSDSTLQDAATACLSDTRYACTYNASNHTVSCPARAQVSRSVTAAWDIGTYQYSGVGAPAPPTNLTATVN